MTTYSQITVFIKSIATIMKMIVVMITNLFRSAAAKNGDMNEDLATAEVQTPWDRVCELYPSCPHMTLPEDWSPCC